MNTSIHTFNQEELSNFKNTELATIYNKFAVELIGVSQIKKFADKKSAVRRVTILQDTYIDTKNSVIAKQVKDFKIEKPVKKPSVKDETKIHGLDKDFEWQISVGTKIRKGTILNIIHDGFKNKAYLVEDLIDYLVKNAPKNPNRKLMTPAYAAEYIKWYANKGNIELYKSYNEDED